MSQLAYQWLYLDLKIHPIYIGSQKDFVEEVLISSFKQSSSVDCMFGFFHSTALKLIAPGLVEYFVNSSNPMRLVVSPNIDESDADALREGLKNSQNRIRRAACQSNWRR